MKAFNNGKSSKIYCPENLVENMKILIRVIDEVRDPNEVLESIIKIISK
jgi:hypothetical protein